jgi:tRNA pseudouridine38-40 synthase
VDIEAVRATCARLCGRLDFRSFAANPKRQIDSYVRHVTRFEVFALGDLLCFNVVGESFLYKMVRSMVGYAVHVGVGHGVPEDTARVLAARDRCAAADSAPAHGLFLAKVFFAADEWRAYQPLLPPFAWKT